MAKLIGIGGVFLFANDPELLGNWYNKYFDFSLSPLTEDDGSITYYQELYYRDFQDPGKKLHIVYAIMSAKHELVAPKNQFMVNYQVDDLDEFVKRFHEAGIPIDTIRIMADAEGKGKFTHLYDPEGNRIELWQHID